MKFQSFIYGGKLYFDPKIGVVKDIYLILVYVNATSLQCLSKRYRWHYHPAKPNGLENVAIIFSFWRLLSFGSLESPGVL